MKSLSKEVISNLKSFLPIILKDAPNEDDAKDFKGEFEDDVPTLTLTVATNRHGDSWSYQTGDNSYSGDCYSMAHWAVVYLSQDSEPLEILEDIQNQLEELLNS